MPAHPTDIVVVAVARTPFGRFEGALKNIVGPRLGALAINEVIARSGVAPNLVAALYGGVGEQAAVGAD